MLNIPSVPAFRPDPAMVAAIRAAIQRIRLADLNRAVNAARRVV